MRRLRWLLLLGTSLAGCGQDPSLPNRFATGPAPAGSYNDPYALDPNLIKFLDHAESNADVTDDLLSLEFTTQDGQPRPLKEIAQGKTLVLVMTRGYSGSICPYCTTQVSRMIARFDEFEKRKTQVVVVYPVAKQDDAEKRDELIHRAVAMLGGKADVPFPVLLDVELKGVDALGIRRDLSKPATYILDAKGRLQFAYVGNSLADRPSVQAMLEQIDRINKESRRS